MSGQGWPGWLEALRPDELTRRRLHKQVMTAAETMLRLPDRTWHDVTARWSSVLTPLAAGLAVAFGMLAYRASIGPEADSGEPLDVPTEAIALDVRELRPLLASDDAALPELLIDENELNREAVFLAALGSQ